MKFCHQCGNKLEFGIEKYCPECGISLQFSISPNTGSKSTGKRDEVHVGNVEGGVSGAGVSGNENIFGGVQWNVSGDIIIIGPEYASYLNYIRSTSLQLESGLRTEQTNRTETVDIDTKIIEARTTKENIEQLLKDIKRVDKQIGTNIRQIRSGGVKISRSELQIKDVVAEGNDQFFKGRYLKAITHFDKALQIDSKYVHVWNNKGVALGKLGKYDESIPCYDKAIEIDSKYAKAWYNKGVTLSNLGKHEEAIKCYDKALEAEKYVGAWYNKGWALDNLGKYNEAIECYDRALEINENYIKAWNNKGVALGKLGKYDESIPCYDKAIEIEERYID